MRRVALILIPLSCLLNQVYAQDYKNDIGLNVAPMLNVIMRGQPTTDTRFTLTYRRKLSENLCLRIMPSISLYSSPFMNENYEIINILSDSVHLGKENHYDYSPNYQMNIGAEYNWGKKYVKWFVGADLFFSYKKLSYFYSEGIYKYPGYPSGSVFMFLRDSITKTQNIYINYAGVGMEFFIGAKIPLGNRWFFAATANFLAAFYMAKQSEYINDAKTDVKKYNVFELNFLAPVGDFSLCYRF